MQPSKDSLKETSVIPKGQIEANRGRVRISRIAIKTQEQILK